MLIQRSTLRVHAGIHTALGGSLGDGTMAYDDKKKTRRAFFITVVNHSAKHALKKNCKVALKVCSKYNFQ